ncbi:hypothetical protein [Candidatus Nitrosocosmicus arcticus]|uniref:Putative Cell Wall protein with PKD repeat domain n=1 Tax=Candidatus Nitrosocosmicus arcticus TaxID=2035267 RepID=A0A557SYM5_9ARCH|nr:hypothetical protein [Candidatus Nitrosocosmicus arcticus]TVP41704.1 putative Cell Wall protein with PKD repeat domain [Candidatus Nitrosocosmicus arcticus]
MNQNHSTLFIMIYAIISSVIGASVLLQISYAQLEENNFDTGNPMTDNLSNSFPQSGSPSSNEDIVIANNNDGTYFVWESDNNGNSEIIFAKRTNNGFDYKLNLSNSSVTESLNPNMLVDNRNIYFTWWEKHDNGTQIPVFRATSDSGTTFGGITTLSQLPFK